jgi:fluoride exporter
MFKLFLIGSGGFIGSVFRYLLSGYIQNLSNTSRFPSGTLCVNTLGCLIIGLLSQLVETHGVFTPETRAFLFIGCLGGFTTFSTFGNESFNLLRDGQHAFSLLNIGLHIFICLGAIWFGRNLAHIIWR